MSHPALSYCSGSVIASDEVTSGLFLQNFFLDKFTLRNYFHYPTTARSVYLLVLLKCDLVFFSDPY